MTLREKIGQLFMIGFYGTRLADDVRWFIETNHIGFVILFSRNIESVSQVRELTGTLHTLGQTPPLIYTDQEGGAIVRFGEMAATAISAMGIGASGSPGNAETAGRIIGEDMKACGIDGVFAPVLDVNIEEDNPVIGVRSFSDQPGRVVIYGERFFKGLKSSGILACGKHYPGHGAASADSHLEIPVVKLSHQQFKASCLHPFNALARKGIDSILTAHVLFAGIAPDIATFSPHLVRDQLRKKDGFNGVVFTDCLEMNAIKDHFSVDEIVKNTMNAGIDVLIPSHTLEFQRELLDRLEFHVKTGVIPEKRIDESLNRITAMKKRYLQQPYGGPAGPGAAKRPLRQNISLEREMADRSITLLRSKRGILPVKPGGKILLLEWEKKIVGPSIAENENRSMVEQVSADYLKNRDMMIFDPLEGSQLPPDLETRLMSLADDAVIAFIYSGTAEGDRNQVRAVNRLLHLRSDAVVVSLGTPYEIKKYPLARTFLVSYGFRKVQLEALFRVLTGEIVPSGKLPVELKGLFPRGYGLSG
ncbi:MAG: beta-N-acetylhexosaminidase [bacterium]|nr:beta-N-acetylhexosaminidase [bacterium]